MTETTMEERHTLVDQQQALDVYLEAMLRQEAPAAPAAAQAREVAPSRPRAADDTPDWAEGRFQVLLFKVRGLTLAVPLVKLYGVLNWPETVTPVFGHASWLLGLVRNQHRNVQILDTAQLVFPEHMRAGEEANYGNIILIDEGRCGLACDKVAEVISLDAAGVKWRSPEGRRPWLAGTVKKHMCALLDSDQLAEMIRAEMPRKT